MKKENYLPSLFFIFDVESVGLHGGAFAVAGGVYNRQRECLFSFAYHRQSDRAYSGIEGDREWIENNVTINTDSLLCSNSTNLYSSFWNDWKFWKEKGAGMFVECGWPVEAGFIEECIHDDIEKRNWQGPYPMHEISSFLIAAGMDPMKSYDRIESELPAHEPLADSRLSARLLFDALDILGI